MRDGKPQRAAGSQPFRKRLNSGSSLCRGKCHGEPSRSVFLRARPAAKMQRRRTHHSVGRLWRCKKRSRWRRVPLASRRLCNAALQNRLMRWLRRALRNVARSSYTDVHPRAVGDAEPHCCGCHAPRVARPNSSKSCAGQAHGGCLRKGCKLGERGLGCRFHVMRARCDASAKVRPRSIPAFVQLRASTRLRSLAAPADVVAVTPAPLLVHSTACVAPAVMATRAPWASGGANVPSAPPPQPEPAVLAALHSRGGELLPDQQGVRVQGWRVQSTQRPIMGRDELHRCVCLRLNPHVRC